MIKSMMLVCAFALAACGGGNKKPETTTTTTTTDPNTATSNTDPNANANATPTGDGQPCTQEVAMVCGDEEIDACLKTPPEGEVHKCVAK